jgi:hypothetical protein
MPVHLTSLALPVLYSQDVEESDWDEDDLANRSVEEILIELSDEEAHWVDTAMHDFWELQEFLNIKRKQSKWVDKLSDVSAIEADVALCGTSDSVQQTLNARALFYHTKIQDIQHDLDRDYKDFLSA